MNRYSPSFRFISHRVPLIFALLLLQSQVLAEQQPVTNPFPEIKASDTKIKLHQIAQGLTMPLWATHAGDRSGRLFVIDQTGQIRLIKGGHLAGKAVLDVSRRMVSLKKGFDERGLLGIAFHPGFANSKSPGYLRMYTYTSEPAQNLVLVDIPLKGVAPDHQSVISEWRFPNPKADNVDPKSRREVFRFDQPQFNHDGGAIAFGRDGYLYIATGDGGQAHDMGTGHSPQGNGQDLMKALGKVLRIDPLVRKGKRKVRNRYSVPDDNPFVGRKDALDVIWAYGLRNPFRMSFDRKTNQLITGDIGQNAIEEIDIIVRGGNYGWRVKEGSFFFSTEKGKVGAIYKDPIPGTTVPKGLIDPVAQYDHDEGISVIGGFVYRGKRLPKLNGLYVFGEWTKAKKTSAGRVMTANLKTGEIRELKRLKTYVTGLGEDQEGELYVLTSEKAGTGDRKSGKVYKTGKVLRIQPG